MTTTEGWLDKLARWFTPLAVTSRDDHALLERNGEELRGLPRSGTSPADNADARDFDRDLEYRELAMRVLMSTWM